MVLLNLFIDYFSVLSVILFLSLAFLLYSKRKLNLPPGPYCLPIVGYLPFLGQEPHEKLSELADKYGKIFSLQLGRSNVVVLADYECVKEAFNKSSTADRPPDLFHFLPGQLGLASINGDDWVEQRRYTLKAMKDLGLGKSKWETDVQEEVKDFVRFIEQHEGKPLDVKAPLIATISNNILSLIFGYHFPLDDSRRVAINRGIHAFPKLFVQTGLACVFPAALTALEKIGIDIGSSLKKDLVAFNDFVSNEIKSRKENMRDENKEGYVHRYLADLKHENKHSSFNEKSLVGNVQAYIFGGVETTMTTLHWLFLAMATHPDIQLKIHKELDSILGDQDEPQWSEHSKFPYTYATILEVMRWRTLAPLNLSHLTREDIKIGGYDVPKNTVLVGLLSALHKDTKYWPESEVFRPERFIDENGKILLRKDSWAPFSLGKRNCPGEIVAMVELFLYFASIMHKFNIQSVERSPDLKGILGIVLSPKDSKLRFHTRKSKEKTRNQ